MLPAFNRENTVCRDLREPWIPEFVLWTAFQIHRLWIPDITDVLKRVRTPGLNSDNCKFRIEFLQ